MALTACAVIQTGPASAATTRTPLPWRVGGRVGFTVDAATFPDSSGYSLDVYLRISPATVADATKDSLGIRRFRLGVQLRSGSERGWRRVEQDITMTPADSVGGFGKVVLLRMPARPGPQRLKVRLEDVQSRKRGIAYSGTTARESAEISGEFAMPAAQQGRDLSSPEFVWDAAKGGTPGPFERSGRTVIPNPERLYGLFARGLQIAFSARAAEERPWRWRVRLLDGRGQPVATRDSTAAASRWLEAAYLHDVSDLPAGGYDAELQVWQDGDARPLTRRERFSVAWHPESWLRNPVETEDLVHLVLGGQEEERFMEMHPGEQERWLDDFWRKRDPSPGTPENEARATFLERVVAANQRFGRFGLTRGMFSDMGRVYVRYGEPSEVLKQVMPAGDQTLVQMLQQLALEEDRPLGGIRQKGPGGDMRPFEVWIYEGEIPTPPDADPTLQRGARHQRLVFLFVDEHGLGDYRMRYSNE